MDPEHIIDETATIQGASIEKVYDRCRSWIWKRRGALIKEKQKPTKLVAYHSIVGGDISTENKVMQIYLSESQEGVSVRLIMDTVSKEARRVLINPSLTATYWSYLVESLWTELGIEMDIEWRRRMYPRHHLDTVIAEKRSWTILRCFLSLMIIAMGLIFEPMQLIFSLMGFGYLLYTMYQYYQFVRIRDNLYPER
ncbi:hypothetical protein ISS39_05795 [Candidatus Bathyarchaeota archaeon]|nr:hypothetical protein [Candidatus Bathyarchaeota archaeon]